MAIDDRDGLPPQAWHFLNPLTLEEVLALVAKRGLVLWLYHGKIAISGRRADMTPDLFGLIAYHTDEITKILMQRRT
jgi:hypothetical protein